MENVALSVVIPALNEERRLPGTLQAIDGYLAALGLPYELIVVDDGSFDRTAAIAQAFRPAAGWMRRVTHPQRRGKGAAVRTGMLMASGQVCCFLDADLSAGPDAMAAVIEPVRSGNADLAIGSRYAEGALISRKQPLLRRVLSFAFRTLVQRMLPGIRDSQAGVKAFSAQAVRSLFPPMRTCGFTFDVELLLRARRLGLCIAEVPIIWRHEELSKLHMLLGPARMLIDLARIVLFGRRWLLQEVRTGARGGFRKPTKGERKAW